MKKNMGFFICCPLLLFALVSLVGVTTASAQGFTGPGANPQTEFGANQPAPPPGPGVNPPPPPPGTEGFSDDYGFTGPSEIVTVVQAQAFDHRTPVVIRGNIVRAIGGDLYTFSDTSGEIIIRIGPREWELFGSIISPSNTIEISGELHRDERDWQRGPEIHARYIRKL